MKTKVIPIILLLGIAVFCVAGVKIIRLPRATTFPSNTVFSASIGTGYTGRVTVHVQAHDLARGLGPWITNSGSGGSATNAVSTTRTNGTVISTASTSLDFIEGTNVVIRATNAAGVVTVQINASGGGSVDPTNAVLANIIGTGAATNVSAGLSISSGVISMNASISNLAINFAFTNYVDSSDNITTVVSNVANGTRIEMEAGTYTVTPSILSSNHVTSTVFQGVKLVNKTNVTIKGVKGLTIWDGSGSLGEAFVITNCDNVTIEGVTFRGMTNHNFMALPGFGGTTNNNNYLWSLVAYYASSRLTFKDCTVERSADHGISDEGAKGSVGGPFTTIISTNQIRIINCTFNDIGGMRTNQAGGLQTDGTAIVCTDATIQGNTFVNCFRGVEPYNEAEAAGNVTFANCIIQGNSFINIAEHYITFAGSTNGNNVLIDGNYMYREPGFLYHGTNTDNGFGGAYGNGININGGNRHILRGNVIKGMAGAGISIQTSQANPVQGVSVVGNFIEGVTNPASTGYGMFIGDPAFGVVFPVRNAYIANNTIRNAKTYAFYALGLSDSTIENNELVNPVFPGAGAAINIQSAGGSIVSNVVVRQNQIKDTGTAEMTYGINVTAGCLAIQTFNNRIENGTTGTILNGAGAGLTQYDTDSSSTNRILRAFDSGAAQITSVTSTTVTAQSFIGSGTGVPILKLQTAMSADNAFAITVATNRFASTTNIFDFTNVVAAQVISAHSSSAGQVVWTNATAAGGSQTPATSDIDFQRLYSATNLIRMALGTAADSGTQTPTLILGGTNSAGTSTSWRISNTNGLLTFQGPPNAITPATLSTNGALILNVSVETAAGATLSAGNVKTAGNGSAYVQYGGAVDVLGFGNGLTMRDAGTATTGSGLWFGGQRRTNNFLQAIQSSINNSNGVINIRPGDTNGFNGLGAGWLDLQGTNTVIAPTSINSQMGAQLWSDGTNLCVVLQNSAGTRTTNKLSMTAWP